MAALLALEAGSLSYERVVFGEMVIRALTVSVGLSRYEGR
jgi:hypothetical protein